jgi:deazaflavin-dependent oxidoreductase (nitroreductase family)
MQENKQEEILRQSFKQFNKIMVLFWRLGFGKWINFWPEGLGQILVITHTGRKSGLRRRTPVNYACIDGNIYCTAGFGAGSDWYLNILSNPSVQIWLPGGWWKGTARDISGSPERLPILREVLIKSGFAASAFGGMKPKVISDLELLQLTEGYRLIQIEKEEKLSGPGGPGDLIWVWPVAGLIVLAVLLISLFRRQNQSK